MKKAIFALASFFFLFTLVFAETEMNIDPQLGGFRPDELFDRIKGWEKNFKLPEIDEIKEGKAVRSLVIGPAGKVKMTEAEVTAVSKDNFTAKIWGLSLVVRVDEQTKFVVGRLRDWSLAEMKTGDKVDVFGEMNGADGSVKAELVNARISVPRIFDEEVNRLRSLIESLIRQLQEALRRAGRSLPPTISPLPESSPTPGSATSTPIVSPTPAED